MQGILTSQVLTNVGTIPISDKLRVSPYFQTMLSLNIDSYRNQLFVAAEGNLLLTAEIVMGKSYSFKLVNITQYYTKDPNNDVNQDDITNLLLVSERILVVSTFTKVLALDTTTLKLLWIYNMPECVSCLKKQVTPKIILHEKSNSLIIMNGQKRIQRIDSKGNKVDIPINFLASSEFIHGISLTRDRFLSMISFNETSGNSKIVIFNMENNKLIFTSPLIIDSQCSRITSSYISLNNVPSFNIWIQCQVSNQKIETTFGIQVFDNSFKSNLFTMTNFKLVGHANDEGSKIAMIDESNKNTLVVFDLANSSKYSTPMLTPREGQCSEVLLSDHYYSNCLNGDRLMGQYLLYSQ